MYLVVENTLLGLSVSAPTHTHTVHYNTECLAAPVSGLALLWSLLSELCLQFGACCVDVVFCLPYKGEPGLGP